MWILSAYAAVVTGSLGFLVWLFVEANEEARALRLELMRTKRDRDEAVRLMHKVSDEAREVIAAERRDADARAKSERTAAASAAALNHRAAMGDPSALRQALDAAEKEGA